MLLQFTSRHVQCIYQTWCSQGRSTIPVSLIYSFTDWPSHPFPPNLHNTKNPKPLQLITWNFDTMSTSYHVSCVPCHLSPVTCHLSHVTCHVYIFFFYKLVKLVDEWSVINRAYPVFFFKTISKFLPGLWVRLQLWTVDCGLMWCIVCKIRDIFRFFEKQFTYLVVFDQHISNSLWMLKPIQHTFFFRIREFLLHYWGP